MQKCITFSSFSQVHKFASCLKADQEKMAKSSPNIFREVISLYVAGNRRDSFQKCDYDIEWLQNEIDKMKIGCV